MRKQEKSGLKIAYKAAAPVSVSHPRRHLSLSADYTMAGCGLASLRLMKLVNESVLQ